MTHTLTRNDARAARLPRLPSSRMPPPPPSPRTPHRRSSALVVGSALTVVVLVAMLIRLQVLQPERYVAKGVGQRQVRTTLVGLRGSIFDRNGETLAMSLPARAVVADPRHVKNPDAQAKILAPLLGVDVNRIRAALERPDTGFSYVARQLDPEVAERVEDLRMAGVYVTDESRRVSAADNLGLSLVGRMDAFGESAMFGLEKSMDRQLKGSDGQRIFERGADGGTIVGSEETISAPSAGSDVTLTIDRSMQFWAETALETQVGLTNSAAGTAIVGNPKTGEIYAMAAVTSADGEIRPSKLNTAVRTFEPGSVMKLVTAAAAFEANAVTLDQVFVVPDVIQVADKKVRDSHSHPPEAMTVSQIIAESSNVGTIKMAQLVGREGILDTLDRFGFGKPTSLGLYREQAGDFRRKWYGSDIGSIPIGQSITATPLQIWSAYSTIANRGTYVKPKLVQQWTDDRGRIREPERTRPHQVVSPETASLVTQALQKVVEEGTGKEWSIPGYSIAGKTGTAWQPIGGGVVGYGSAGNRHYAASFAGFFPATDPRLTIVVVIDDPKNGDPYGADVAGPVFDRLAKEGMRRYGIAGDTEVAAQAGKPLRARPATTATLAPPTTIPPTTVAPTTIPPEAVPPATVPPATGG